jgi:hypothetical protein
MRDEIGEVPNHQRRRPWRLDPISALLAVSIAVALGWTAWLRYGPEAAALPLKVGTLAPRLQLVDPATSRPLALLGLRGRVVWVAFWAAGTPTSGADRAALERVWRRLKDHRLFTMVAAAVDSPERIAPAATKSGLPVYIAAPEMQRAFGADARHLPLHVLIDETGRVGAVAQGMAPETLARLAEQAEAWLDVLEPPGAARFAGGGALIPGSSAPAT